MSITIKFPMGKIVGTAAIGHWADCGPQITETEQRQSFLAECLTRHASGDWGNVDPEDVGLNDQSLSDGTRILSVYPIPTALVDDAPDDSLWIITEGDRSYTTILFPSDY